MSRSRLRHPSKAMTAEYGLDHACGWFVTIYKDGARGGCPEVEYDQRLNPEMKQLYEVLQKFINHGFFTTEELDEALEAMQHETLDTMDAKLRTIATVVMNLKGDH